MHPQRLSRLTTLYPKQTVYFVTLCTFDRKMILNRPAIHSAFVSFCESAAAQAVYVGRYVLMPDHIHPFVTSSLDGLDLSAWIKSLKNTLSKTWRSEGLPAPHWQKGFFDHLLRSNDSYEDKWTYVVANPVRAGLVAAADDWPYQGTICKLNCADLRRS